MKSMYDIHKACLDKQSTILTTQHKIQKRVMEKNHERIKKHCTLYPQRKILYVSFASNLMLLLFFLLLLLRYDEMWIYCLLCLDLISILVNGFLLFLSHRK